jgi:hypothetical protein
MWRLDANWKALRMEVPWIKELPSETMRRQVRFTTQPLEQPASLDKLRALLSVVDGMDEMLMFATDYPTGTSTCPRRRGGSFRRLVAAGASRQRRRAVRAAGQGARPGRLRVTGATERGER